MLLLSIKAEEELRIACRHHVDEDIHGKAERKANRRGALIKREILRPLLVKGFFPLFVHGRNAPGNDREGAEREQRSADRTREKHRRIAP